MSKHSLCYLADTVNCRHCVEVDTFHAVCFQLLALIHAPFNSKGFHVFIVLAFRGFVGKFFRNVEVEAPSSCFFFR